MDVRCEAGSILVDIYGEEGRVPESKQILLKALETSPANQYWHCKLLFQAAVSLQVATLQNANQLGPLKTGQTTLKKTYVIMSFSSHL